MSHDSLSPEEEAARKEHIQKELDRLAASRGNTQVILNEGMTAKELLQELDQRAQKDIQAYKPVSPLNKIMPVGLRKEATPKGKPVVQISNGGQGGMMEDCMNRFLAVTSKGRPKLSDSDEVVIKADRLINKGLVTNNRL